MEKVWNVKKLKNIKFNKPVLVEGLPGIGNVGKIAVDFIIETLGAKKIYEIYSDTFPNCVFVNEKGVAELPRVEVYHKKLKENDLLLVSGDAQPIDERGCYDFCDKLLELFQNNKGKEIISLAGLGMKDIPKSPRIYCAGTDKEILQKYKTQGVNNSAGMVGPIVGVSGLLIGLAKKRGLKGATLLVETLGHPTYLGIKEARELLKVINKTLKLGLDMNSLNQEVKIIEKEIKERIDKSVAIKEDKRKAKKETLNYIG